MNKELQDLVWSVLPKEFKEEVKKVARIYSGRTSALLGAERHIANKFLDEFIGLFGRHNLTSDAEGEVRLTVSRKRVQEMYAHYDKISNDPNRPKDYIESIYEYADGVTIALDDLFGSKCLPDNVDNLSQNPTENCDNESHISADCNKQSEPEFKRCEMVTTPSGEVCIIEDTHFENGSWLYLVGEPAQWITESDLEPYTEPTDLGREVNFPTKNNLAIYLKKSKNCDNRLQIAAMAMQGILSNENAIQYAINNFRLQDGSRNRYQAVAECSLAFADALIAESEKRSEHGK